MSGNLLDKQFGIGGDILNPDYPKSRLVVDFLVSQPKGGLLGGGGANGGSGMTGSSIRARSRFILRKGFGNYVLLKAANGSPIGLSGMLGDSRVGNGKSKICTYYTF